MRICSVVQAFALGEYSSHIVLAGGVINNTYLVFLKSGERYVVQDVKYKEVFRDICDNKFERVVEAWSYNYIVAREALSGSGMVISNPVKHKGRCCLVYKNKYWRVFEYIENDGKLVKDEEIVYSAGFALGKFHELLLKADYRPMFSVPDFHNTMKVVKKMQQLVRKNYKNRGKRVKATCDLIATEAEESILPSTLPVSLIFGDPKLNNFLFKRKRVIGIIDLDTMMLGSRYLDIGDAIRSWCKHRGKFNGQFFKKSISGYNLGFGTPIDVELSLKATKLITLELAARYMIDYFEEAYFKWDSKKFKSASEHNLYRCLELVEYFKTINMDC